MFVGGYTCGSLCSGGRPLSCTFEFEMEFGASTRVARCL